MKLKSFVMIFLVGGSMVFSAGFLQTEINSFKKDFEDNEDKISKQVDKQEIVFWLYILSALGYSAYLLIWILNNIRKNLLNIRVVNTFGAPATSQ